MKREDKTEQALERIKQRLDGIEKMLTMLLMSDVISEYADGVCLDITDEVKAILAAHGFEVVRTEPYGDKAAVYVKASEQRERVTLAGVMAVMRKVQERYRNLILVFIMNRVNGNQRKRLLEENISFVVDGEITYISGQRFRSGEKQ